MHDASHTMSEWSVWFNLMNQHFWAQNIKIVYYKNDKICHKIFLKSFKILRVLFISLPFLLKLTCKGKMNNNHKYVHCNKVNDLKMAACYLAIILAAK